MGNACGGKKQEVRVKTVKVKHAGVDITDEESEESSSSSSSSSGSEESSDEEDEIGRGLAVGRLVALRGLKTNTELNGSLARVMAAEDDAGRIEVREEEGEDVYRLKRDNLVLIALEAHHQVDVDTQVVLRGLVSHPHLNGCLGRVLDVDREKARFEVKESSSGETFRLKQENLLVVEAPETFEERGSVISVGNAKAVAGPGDPKKARDDMDDDHGTMSGGKPPSLFARHLKKAESSKGLKSVSDGDEDKSKRRSSGRNSRGTKRSEAGESSGIGERLTALGRRMSFAGRKSVSKTSSTTSNKAGCLKKQPSGDAPPKAGRVRKSIAFAVGKFGKKKAGNVMPDVFVEAMNLDLSSGVCSDPVVDLRSAGSGMPAPPMVPGPPDPRMSLESFSDDGSVEVAGASRRTHLSQCD